MSVHVKFRLLLFSQVVDRLVLVGPLSTTNTSEGNANRYNKTYEYVKIHDNKGTHDK